MLSFHKLPFRGRSFPAPVPCGTLLGREHGNIQFPEDRITEPPDFFSRRAALGNGRLIQIQNVLCVYPAKTGAVQHSPPEVNTIHFAIQCQTGFQPGVLKRHGRKVAVPKMAVGDTGLGKVDHLKQGGPKIRVIKVRMVKYRSSDATG